MKGIVEDGIVLVSSVEARFYLFDPDEMVYH